MTLKNTTLSSVVEILHNFKEWGSCLNLAFLISFCYPHHYFESKEAVSYGSVQQQVVVT